MPTNKTQRPYTHGKEPVTDSKNAMSRATPTMRSTSVPRAPSTKPSSQPAPLQPALPQPARPHPAGPKLQSRLPTTQPVRKSSTAAKGPSDTPKAKAPLDNESRTTAQSAPTKRSTPWTVEAASRVASVSAKKGDGTVKKGSFAADAMSRAMKHERNGKREK